MGEAAAGSGYGDVVGPGRRGGSYGERCRGGSRARRSDGRRAEADGHSGWRARVAESDGGVESTGDGSGDGGGSVATRCDGKGSGISGDGKCGRLCGRSGECCDESAVGAAPSGDEIVSGDGRVAARCAAGDVVEVRAIA